MSGEAIDTSTIRGDGSVNVRLPIEQFFELYGPNGGGALLFFGKHIEVEAGRLDDAVVVGKIHGRGVQQAFELDESVGLKASDTIMVSLQNRHERQLVAEAIEWWAEQEQSDADTVSEIIDETLPTIIGDETPND